MLNIPEYRAKCIDSDEYVIGNYIKVHNKFYIYEDGTSDIYLDDEECFDDGSIDGEIRIIDLIFEIDQTTLAIHFEGMLDSEGNKIFASLSEDGKGGDILEHTNRLTSAKMILVASYHQAKGELGAYSGTHYIRSMKFHLTKIVGIQNIKVIGIQE